MSIDRTAYDLLKEWEKWEGDIIADDKAWPKNQMTINGVHYDKMIELQNKRNVVIKSLYDKIWTPDPTCGKCGKNLSRCTCAY